MKINIYQDFFWHFYGRKKKQNTVSFTEDITAGLFNFDCLVGKLKRKSIIVAH